MFVTFVEAHVAADREFDLVSAWEAAPDSFPEGFIESSLVRSESGEWRIVTVWESREAVLAMRGAGRPAALVMFEAAGASPTVSMWDVVGRKRPS
ncbi:MAG: antibiotic biosynthesis monooxygenase [Actinomycetales bacterium]|nr:antibiotic biosynthesis monooxygenase [Actinomycetales bacterium]